MNVQLASGSQKPNPVNKLALREVNILSNVLSRALHDEPHLVYMIPQEEMRRTAAPGFSRLPFAPASGTEKSTRPTRLMEPLSG